MSAVLVLADVARSGVKFGRRCLGMAISDGGEVRCSQSARTCAPVCRSDARLESSLSFASSAIVCIRRSDGSCRSNSVDC